MKKHHIYIKKSNFNKLFLKNKKIEENKENEKIKEIEQNKEIKENKKIEENKENEEIKENLLFWSVCLKKPKSRNIIYMDINNTNFINDDDINIWINNNFNKTNNQWINYILYNDETGTKKSESSCYGHTKGILVWNKNKIGWLIHSIPKYPKNVILNDKITFTEIANNELIYGQSAIYIELDINHLDDILKQINLMHGHIYKSTINNNYHHESIKINKYIINNNIFHIAKNKEWNKDIYNDYLVEELKTNCYCETWIRGECIKSTENVINIKQIKWNDNIIYCSTHDHSKYAISFECENPWVYIGDINHMTSQSKRGGGGIIIHDKNLWQAFFNLINNIEK
jgi:deoxyribonuclease-2